MGIWLKKARTYIGLDRLETSSEFRAIIKSQV